MGFIGKDGKRECLGEDVESRRMVWIIRKERERDIELRNVEKRLGKLENSGRGWGGVDWDKEDFDFDTFALVIFVLCFGFCLFRLFLFFDWLKKRVINIFLVYFIGRS